MSIFYCTYEDYARRLPFSRTQWSSVAEPPVDLVVVDFSAVSNPATLPLLPYPPTCPVLGINIAGSADDKVDRVPTVDVVANNAAEVDLLSERVMASPRASSVLTGLLRQSLELSVEQALLAESLAYSTLQHGEEFKRFLAAHRKEAHHHAPVAAQDEPAVLVKRKGEELRLRLNRPARRNAYSVEMRDALCESLMLAQLDTSILRIKLSGAGPAFCAGGDLAEFGEAREAAVAHLSRATLSAGALLHKLSNRVQVQVQVQGGCVGAGIELPSFAQHISATEDAFFMLPEVSMGLVPGAGGTVSLSRRIGRQRTAWLALSGEPVNAHTALKWGLIDRLSPS